jgi:excisionase family DNA binding protein
MADGDLPEDETRERCDCHVCSTLREALSANVDAAHDSRSPTPLLLTYGQAAELMGVTAAVVSGLVREGELRAVTIRTYGRRRIPRVEVDEYISRLLLGQLRAWVEARRDLEQWGLRYMGDQRTYQRKDGRTMQRTVGWHLGDGRTALCGAEPVGRWEIATQVWSWLRVCEACELRRDRLRLEKLARRTKRSAPPPDLVPMQTVVRYEGGGTATRRTGHLGDGHTTLCGLTRDEWKLPATRPRARPCGVCHQVAGIDDAPVRMPRGRSGRGASS